MAAARRAFHDVRVARRFNGEFRDGTPITWRIYLEKDSFDNQLSVATHEWAFAGAGLEDVRWHQRRLAPTETSRQEDWGIFLEQPPIVFIEKKKFMNDPRASRLLDADR